MTTLASPVKFTMETLPLPRPTLRRCGEEGAGHHATALTYRTKMKAAQRAGGATLDMFLVGVGSRWLRLIRVYLMEVIVDFKDAKVRRGP